MSDSNNPEMSVIIVTPDRYNTIRKTIKHLRAQTVRDKLEIVIVAPSVEELKIDEPELREFSQFRVIEVGKVNSAARAKVRGILEANAPIVDFAEDHSFPDQNWAEALIEAHNKPWAVVGPVIRNANPDTILSWAELFIAYAPWLDPSPAGMADHLPGHNSSYKREILLNYGPELEEMLEPESVLHWDLKKKGYRLWLEPKAKTNHLNMELIIPAIEAQYYSGRLFAAVRARNLLLPKRICLVGAAPLIPLVRLIRIVHQVNRSRINPALVKTLPFLTLALLVSAFGEMIGYTMGAGNAKDKLTIFEFHRVRYLRKKCNPEESVFPLV